MMADLILYLSEEQHDRLAKLLQNMSEYQDIYNEMANSEYCECFECENNNGA